MSLVKTKQELRALIDYNNKIGFVPTMGYLHNGHLSLITRAKSENDLVVVSIFVNPTQFAPHEDLEAYPRDIDRDYKLATEAGADVIYYPEIDEIYMKKASTFVEVEGEMTNKLCGKSRPTHFKGVTTVVNILFNIVNPNNAYFGQKDAQQAIIIKKMVMDLHMNIKVIICPIVREIDGLAMSSRNIYLNKAERNQAVILNQALKVALDRYKQGENNVTVLKALITNMIEQKPLAIIDYVEILDADTLEEIKAVEKSALAAVAVKFGNTRLIDNIFLS